MMTSSNGNISALLAICAGNSPLTGELPAQVHAVTRSFDVFFNLRLDERLSKQSWGCDLRRHRAHYDVTVMATVNKQYKIPSGLLGMVCHRDNPRTVLVWLAALPDTPPVFLPWNKTRITDDESPPSITTESTRSDDGDVSWKTWSIKI